MKRSLVTALAVVNLLAVLACSAEPQIQEVEVTREVPVAQEVPVTVEIIQTVEVTREVPVVEEVPVTVETVRTVEVTRMVEKAKTVEVTREVPVTLIATVTPAPSATDATKESQTLTPVPEVVPTPTPTPEPATEGHFGNWQWEQKQYGDWKIRHYRNTAVDHETSSQAPVLTFRCDNKGERALYIDWNHALATTTSTISRYSGDPFEQYRDTDLDALAALANQLLGFTNGLQLTRTDATEWDVIWKRLQRQWELDPKKSADLIHRISDRNHRSVLINMDFHLDSTNPDKLGPYGPLLRENISAMGILLPIHRTQIDAGALGELKAAYRESFPEENIEADISRTMTATVTAPEQPAPVVATWEVSGLSGFLTGCAYYAW